MTRISLTLAVILTLFVGTSEAGTVTAVSVGPNPVEGGSAVTVTVTGSNSCGAVHIIYGDGTAITYPIVELPSNQTHTYTKGGQFTIRAQGMGNCNGEATTTIRVTEPPVRPQITGLRVDSASSKPGASVTITVEGTGPCTLVVDFGDGNTQEFAGPLPRQVKHA